MNTRSQVSLIRRQLRTISEGMHSYSKRGAYVSALKRLGFYELGRGGFAVTMGHERFPDVVVKVGQVESGKSWLRGRHRDRFMRYCEWLQESGSRSKYALRVYHHEWLSEAEGGTYVAVVERCKHSGRSKAVSAVAKAGSVVEGTPYRDISGFDRHAARFIERIAHLGTLDLHSANVMVRPNGQPVITDPLC